MKIELKTWDERFALTQALSEFKQRQADDIAFFSRPECKVSQKVKDIMIRDAKRYIADVNSTLEQINEQDERISLPMKQYEQE